MNYEKEGGWNQKQNQSYKLFYIKKIVIKIIRMKSEGTNNLKDYFEILKC
jgi:hypothetical protein